MGNQESLNAEKLSNHLAVDFDLSSMTYLYHVENANLVKFHLRNDCQLSQNRNKSHKNTSPLFFLQKIFVSDSQQEYKLLSKYLEKSSLFNMQPQSNEIIKIVKIYQQAQKGICSNRYFIKALFQYSDITIRQELKIRASNRLNIKNSTIIQKNHFRYQDLCSIMFACISALYTVQKMKNHFKKFVGKNILSKQHSFRHLEQFFDQFRYNIPLSLDRIIIMHDGTIKIMHPLLIDNDNRINHSNKFFYSPQKMRDFAMEDGIKGRIFQTALILLQCALLQSTEQMSKVYNGYCIDEIVLKEKIENAQKIYANMDQNGGENAKLFQMLKKMTENDPDKRLGLDSCIYEAQNLFQVNKKLKQSTNSNIFAKESTKESNDRMNIEELQVIPYQRIAMKVSPIQNSTRQSSGIKAKDDEKTTARIASDNQRETKHFRQNPEVEVSHFDLNPRNLCPKPQERIQKNPLQSLLICNNDQDVSLTQNQQKCLESLIGKGSDLYSTQKYSFLESKFEYQKFNFNQLKNSQIDEKIESNNSSCKKYDNHKTTKVYKYKKLPEQSARNSSEKKYRNDSKSFNRPRLLKEGYKLRDQKSLITTSRFMEIDQIYEKYDFITKTNEGKNAFKNLDVGQSFVEIKTNQGPSKNIKAQQNSITEVPFTYSLESSVKGSSTNSVQKKMKETNKSEVLQKITPELIYEKLKKNRMLR